MPVPNQLISPSTLRRMRLGYNRSLPELVNVFRLASHKQLGPYLGRMVAGTGDEAVYADALAGRQGWTVYLCY